MPKRMGIEERRVGDVTILRLSGRLELDEGDLMLRDHVNNLASLGDVKILLDMRGLTRLDSAGIGMLVSKFLTVRRAGGTIKLLHLAEHIDHLIDITKLYTVFEIFEDEEQAVRSFATASGAGM